MCSPIEKFVLCPTPSAERVNYTGLKNYTEASDAKDDSVCSLCKQYASVGIDYLQDTKTQTEIVETLHRSCSYALSLKTEVSI